MIHCFYMPFFKLSLISVASGKASETVYRTAPVAFILYLIWELLIIYDYLQWIILGKKCRNNCGLDIYCNEW